jgi:hypothetical protein
MSLSLYRGHSRVRGKCAGGHQPDAQTYESDERRRAWKRCSSWKGTLQQYVGWLHRLYDSKRVVEVYDYVDGNVRMLARMYERRLKGYSDMGRGRQYLRIIHGPEYAAAENLSRLRSRSLNAKRSLALCEFALGVKGLERFDRQEPLRHVHECVFGALALESEPVDPRP